MTTLHIPTGTTTKCGVPQHRALNTKRILLDTDGRVWIGQGSQKEPLKPADDGELVALSGYYGEAWSKVVEAVMALDDQ